MSLTPPALVLASTSPIRRRMLEDAGIAHEALAPECDEEALKTQFEGGVPELAEMLAGAKALSVSRARPGAWVVGSDSVVECAGRRFDKPRDRDEAADHLAFLSGRTMLLTSAVALARDGALDWSHRETARLDVRSLSERFIRPYLDAEWPDVAYTVGVFRLEARGIQLFERIEGSHFAILGMPLLPLLGALRARGAIEA